MELWRAQVNETVEFQLSEQPGVGFRNSWRCSHAKHHELHWKFCRKFGRWRTEYGWKILTRLVHVTYSPRKATNLIIILWNWKRISFFLWNWKHIYSCDTRRSGYTRQRCLGMPIVGGGVTSEDPWSAAVCVSISSLRTWWDPWLGPICSCVNVDGDSLVLGHISFGWHWAVNTGIDCSTTETAKLQPSDRLMCSHSGT